MAVLRFARDRRGYEHFYLVEQTSNRRGKVRSRLLYWFRTPPNIKVGREPFDEDVRRMLEAQNPDVVFDWPAILDTPIPPADVERWRERRRMERLARAERIESDGEEAADATAEELPAEPERQTRRPEPPARDVPATEASAVGAHTGRDAEQNGSYERPSDDAADLATAVLSENANAPERDVQTAGARAAAAQEASASTPAPEGSSRRKRRRRRGRRARPAAPPGEAAIGSEPTPAAQESDQDDGPDEPDQ